MCGDSSVLRAYALDFPHSAGKYSVTIRACLNVYMRASHNVCMYVCMYVCISLYASYNIILLSTLYAVPRLLHPTCMCVLSTDMTWTELVGHGTSPEAHHLHEITVPTTSIPTTRVPGTMRCVMSMVASI